MTEETAVDDTRPLPNGPISSMSPRRSACSIPPPSTGRHVITAKGWDVHDASLRLAIAHSSASERSGRSYIDLDDDHEHGLIASAEGRHLATAAARRRRLGVGVPDDGGQKASVYGWRSPQNRA